MVKNPVRRAQLIAPFGVGALMVVKDGTSLITAGIDHWYKHEGGKQTYSVDESEFRIEEWRLQRLLEVDHFRLPPDYRDKEEIASNKYLRVPFLRFPQWHFCPYCKRLYRLPLTSREKTKCADCDENNRTKYLVQVPFVAMCEKGHIQDFPWVEWVHKSITPTCNKKMKIIATGGSSLGAQIVECECGEKRSLSSITTGDHLSKHLEEGKERREYLCQGKAPWFGTEENQSPNCGQILRGSLRSASNLYYADVRSAIYLPRGSDTIPSQLVTLLEEPTLGSAISVLSGITSNIQPSQLRQLSSKNKELLQDFSDEQIQAALQIVLSRSAKGTDLPIIEKDNEDTETAFRREEFEVLRRKRDEEALVIKETNIGDYHQPMNNYFSRINLVSKLRETRALAGFTRMVPENGATIDEKKALLRRYPPRNKDDNWVPAYVVYGEGIFLEFNEHYLQTWEAQKDVQARSSLLTKQYEQLIKNNRAKEKPLGPRFILLHTFAHLLINRLTFECGYSSAALKERLYISSTPKAPMAGLLIYTAAGDSEGTMGGLVRMGQVGKLEPVIQRALTDAQWCSADPVCMETGLHTKQGSDFYNLAACHNCALIPETACEEFNRFLDRALVVGKLENRELGFFNGNILTKSPR